IKNAYQGVVVEGPSSNAQPKLSLQNCIIDNCYDAGITGVQTAINADNCLISNCGKNIQLLYGGVYRFTHCTDVAYSNDLIQHKQPALTVTDYVESGNAVLSADLDAMFTNCIFWGDQGTVDDEVITGQQGTGLFSIDFNHCLWKVKNQPEGVTVSGLIENQDPSFVNTEARKGYDFRLSEGSPALDQGAATVLPTDLDGAPRNISTPDLGAYERQ
ncbi:MAG: choice-of-anchor Q domain-containing protein, partial [Flavitalea sp.]